ncbi:glutaredoxin-1 [Protopterus annectens]|uniref:glutaredoxin-1 n=1 Tax=Protopterus annectens TaxID=7888 RepID=UPI001CFB4FA5|nr:glutaredoxin-1 [Protopterus annectens]
MAEFVNAKIKGDKVVVFSKPTCPYCQMAVETLKQYSFKPGCLDIIDISSLSDMSGIQDCLQQLTGARTVPRVFIGNECVGGGTDVKSLHQNGQLEGKLRAINALA